MVMPWPGTYSVSALNGPLPIGLRPNACGSAKNACGSGAKAMYPRVSGNCENGSASFTVNVRSSTTARPTSVGLGASALYPSMLLKK